MTPNDAGGLTPKEFYQGLKDVQDGFNKRIDRVVDKMNRDGKKVAIILSKLETQMGTVVGVVEEVQEIKKQCAKQDAEIDANQENIEHLKNSDKRWGIASGIGILIGSIISAVIGSKN
jgi:hypothetical protein